MVSTDVVLILKGESIPTDGSGHVLITDINTNGESSHEALVCQSKLTDETLGLGDWYLNNMKIQTTMDARGWKTDIFVSVIAETLLVRLIRISEAAEEGVFTGHIDENTVASAIVGVYYPSESMFGFTAVVNFFV